MRYDERLRRIESSVKDRERQRERRRDPALQRATSTMQRLVKEAAPDLRAMFEAAWAASTPDEWRAAMDLVERDERAVAIIRASTDAAFDED